MAYYTNLINAWTGKVVPPNVTGDALSGLTTEQQLDMINDWVVFSSERDDVDAKAVIRYLFTNNKFLQLKIYTSNPPNTSAGIAATQLLALLSIPTFTQFEMSDSTLYNYVDDMLTAMAGDVNTGITNEDVVNLLSLAHHYNPWWQVNGYSGPFSQNDLDAAGLI